MNDELPHADGKKHFSRVVLLLVLACSVLIIVAWMVKSRDTAVSRTTATPTAKDNFNNGRTVSEPPTHSALHRLSSSKVSAGEEVAARVSQYTKNRRALAKRYAEKLGVVIPLEMEQLFAAAEAGNLDEIRRLAKLLQAGSATHTDLEREALRQLAPLVKELLGVHEQSHAWPAAELLEYGNSVLGSLKPGMVYLGGTDAGRFIPTLLNETGTGDPHIVLTQNAFADSSYLDYLRFIYGDRLTCLNGEDSQKSFQEYLSDAQRRLAHDQNFPNEPKQVRPGENISSKEGRVQVSGQVAVMSINEAMLQTLMKNNPNLSFAMEESFSLPSTYNGAMPLGPLIELNQGDSRQPLTAETATSALTYWGEISGKILSGPDPSQSEVAKSYGHMLLAQGNLFANQNLTSQAEQAYRLAYRLSPDDPEPVQQLALILARTDRAAEGKQLMDNFAAAHPK